ncbi:Sorting nexin-25 like protein [Argiope bruennichi]|uniref:Sorting nexin-25 like protein n=1 Tax=Argiope bruennichi TaxID=94029 RepID=A0A8T0FC21_ARGBR|nr:Sorting nexin-25 like protein [Argiope bruennichi]
MLFTFRDRCRKIDDVELFTNDFVVIMTEHLQHIRCAVINPAEKIQPYKVYKFLSDKDSELDHLRYLCEFLFATVLPPEYSTNQQLRCLLREVFTVLVFYPVIDKLCDPDFINMKLISYLKQLQLQAEKHRRTYEYAATYEDFIKMIQECNDVEDLQRMRYYIATEIMQSTTMSNLKRLKGMDVNKEFVPQKTNKEIWVSIIIFILCCTTLRKGGKQRSHFAISTNFSERAHSAEVDAGNGLPVSDLATLAWKISYEGRPSDFDHRAFLAAMEEDESLTTQMLAGNFNVGPFNYRSSSQKAWKGMEIGWMGPP